MALGSGGIALSWETLAPHGSQIPCLLFHPWNFGCRKPAWLWISLAPAFLNLKSPKVLQGQVLAAEKGVGLTRRRRSPLEASHIPSPPQCPGLSVLASAKPATPWSGEVGLSQQKHSQRHFIFPSHISVPREKWKCPWGRASVPISLLIVKAHILSLRTPPLALLLLRMDNE